MGNLLRLEIYMPEWLLIDMRILVHIHSSYRHLVDLIGRLNGHASKDQGFAVRREHRLVIRATSDFLYRIVHPGSRASLLDEVLDLPANGYTVDRNFSIVL